ncbi:MAG: carboxypeptidase-like regulatory domain-containing protein [Bacteroidota bacterium]
MKERIFLFWVLLPFLMVSQSQSIDTGNTISGIVLDEDNNPIPKASISIENSFRETESGEDGTFTIAGNEGDILKCTALFKKSVQIQVALDQPLRIVLKPDIELLDEVVLLKKREEELVNTAFGKKKRSSVGYQTKALADFISPADVDMTSVIKKIPDFIWTDDGVNFSFGLRRGLGSITRSEVLLVVDDVPVSQSFLRTLDPSRIESATLLKSLAATVKYGTLGNGGVLLIETKMMASFKKNGAIERPQLLVQGNEYTEQLKLAQTYFLETTPNYLDQLNTATSFQEAKEIYGQLGKDPENNTLFFYIDCADYFEKWDIAFSYQLLSQLVGRANNNPKVLRTIAYRLEENGQLSQAKYIYERILEIRPDQAQSYRDLALIYTKTQELEVAKALYIQMLNNSVPNVDFSKLHSTLANEFQHFVLNHKRRIKFDNVPNDFLVASNTPKIRLVLEWTDPLSEFEVQFVGPEKKYFAWNHSPYGDSEFLQNEIEDGYSIKEFEIDKVPPGEWLVNIKNIKTENTAGRTYLRYTLYKNYGFPSEEKKSLLVPMDKIDEKIILDTFLN